MAMDMLKIVADLIEKANATDSEHERAAFLEKAETLMSKYKLDEAAVRAKQLARGQGDISPREVTDKRILFVPESDPFYSVHLQVAGALSILCEVKMVIVQSWDYETFSDKGELHLVGYTADIDYFQLLWTSAHLAFSGKLFPEWNRGLPSHKQIRAWVEAGYKWDHIWDAARKNNQPFTRTVKGQVTEVPRPPYDNGWMKRQLKKAYDETGEEKPKLSHGVTNYRNSYANGFCSEFCYRVQGMVNRRRNAASAASTGAELVLQSDQDAVEKRFNELFPPETLGFAITGTLKGDHADAAASGRASARNADLSGGSGGIANRSAAAAIG